MKKESKSILGQWIGNRLYFSHDEKWIIIKDYLSGHTSKQSVYERYTGYLSEHGKINKWMRELGIEDKSVKKTNFVSMPTRKKDKEQSSEDFETLQLKSE